MLSLTPRASCNAITLEPRVVPRFLGTSRAVREDPGLIDLCHVSQGFGGFVMLDPYMYVGCPGVCAGS